MATKHYVNNEEFLKALKKHRAAVNKARKEKREEPRVPEYIGKCILEIATRFSTRPNFVMYWFRDEMISDAYENCITYLLNFNPRVSKNPFAYFTQIVYYAFLRRIEKEHKHSYIKHKATEDLMLQARAAGMGEHVSEWPFPPADSQAQSVTAFVENFEEKLANKKNKQKNVRSKDAKP